MFIRVSALLLPVLALSSVVAAAPEPIVARDGSSCSNGTLQCCTSTFDVSYHALLVPEMTEPMHLSLIGYPKQPQSAPESPGSHRLYPHRRPSVGPQLLSYHGPRYWHRCQLRPASRLLPEHSVRK